MREIDFNPKEHLSKKPPNENDLDSYNVLKITGIINENQEE